MIWVIPLQLSDMKILIFLSTLALMSPIGHAQVIGRGRVSVDSLSARSAPVVRDNSFVCSLPNAKELNILEISRDGRWYKVDVGSATQCRGAKTAWVRAEPFFKHFGKTASGVVKGTAGLNVRVAPGASSGVICRLKTNAPISIVGPAGSDLKWVKVDLKDQPGCRTRYGYASADYIDEIQSVDLQESETDNAVLEGFDPGAQDESQSQGAITCPTCSSQTSDAEKAVVEIQDQMVAGYSEHSKVRKMLDTAIKSKRLRSTGYCFRYVKRALQAAGLVPDTLPGTSAKDAGPTLKKRGFVNLMEMAPWKDKIQSPFDAPTGAVLVYAGGRHGHIELRSDKPDGFVSDYFSESARTGDSEDGLSGSGRALIGVYIKPGSEI
jgi:hypothetical protein